MSTRAKSSKGEIKLMGEDWLSPGRQRELIDPVITSKCEKCQCSSLPPRECPKSHSQVTMSLSRALDSHIRHPHTVVMLERLKGRKKEKNGSIAQGSSPITAKCAVFASFC